MRKMAGAARDTTYGTASKRYDMLLMAVRHAAYHVNCSCIREPLSDSVAIVVDIQLNDRAGLTYAAQEAICCGT